MIRKNGPFTRDAQQTPPPPPPPPGTPWRPEGTGATRLSRPFRRSPRRVFPGAPAATRAVRALLQAWLTREQGQSPTRRRKSQESQGVRRVRASHKAAGRRPGAFLFPERNRLSRRRNSKSVNERQSLSREK